MEDVGAKSRPSGLEASGTRGTVDVEAPAINSLQSPETRHTPLAYGLNFHKMLLKKFTKLPWSLGPSNVISSWAKSSTSNRSSDVFLRIFRYFQVSDSKRNKDFTSLYILYVLDYSRNGRRILDIVIEHLIKFIIGLVKNIIYCWHTSLICRLHYLHDMQDKPDMSHFARTITCV